MENNSVGKQLKLLGFHKNEISVYLALFELRKARASDIIAHTKLHRNLVYTALDVLVQRELATKTLVKGVAEFIPNDPNRLVEEGEARTQIAKRIAEELKKRQTETPREVAVYEGVEGIERSRNKTLRFADETLYLLGSQKTVLSEMDSPLRSLHKKRERRNIKLRILSERSTTTNDVPRVTPPLSETRLLPFGEQFPVWFAGIGDHFEIGIPGDNPLTFSIRSKEAVEGFKTFFDHFWNQKVYMVTGFAALCQAFYAMLSELEKGEEYFVLGATLSTFTADIVTFFDQYHQKRIEKGVVVNMLASHESYENSHHRFARFGDPTYKISHIKKFISAVPQPFQINLYKGKTQMILHGEEPAVIFFDRPEVYTGFKLYFDALWKK